MSGCATGPCDRSLEMGGDGCGLCDVTAKLPQQKPKSDLQKNDKATLKGIK